MKNDQKSLIIENNFSDICERCKNAPVSLICPECTPFHNYCKRCDKIVHELPSRTNHERSTNPNSKISDNKSNYQIQKIDHLSQNELIITSPSRNNYQLEPEINQNFFNHQKEHLSNIPIINNSHEEILSNSMNINNIPIMTNENVLSYPKTPQRSHINVDILNNQSSDEMEINNNNLEYIEMPKKNNDQIYIKTFTKEYVMELQNIHQKEKNELLFKISSLENALERVKNSFNEQVKKMQANQNSNDKEMASKLELIEEKYNNQLENIVNEKDMQINLLNEQIKEEKESANEAYIALEKVKNQYKMLENNSINHVNDINNELNLIKKEYSDFRDETDNIIEKLKSEYENKINNMMEDHENEIADINIKNKMEIENINSEINIKYQQMTQELQEDNFNLRQDNTILVQKLTDIEEALHKISDEYNNDVKELNNKLEQKINQNNILENKINEINTEFKKLKTDNENMMKQLNEKKDENNRVNEEKTNLKNSVKNLKNINDALTEKYNKLQSDYYNLSSQTDSLSFEYTKKIKSLSYIEDRNAMLERENNCLKNKLSKCINPFA